MHFANQALFIGIATMLWALDIRKARNKAGEEVIPDPDAFVDDGLVVYVDLSNEPGRSSTEADSDVLSSFAWQSSCSIQVCDDSALPGGRGVARTRTRGRCVDPVGV